MCGRAAVGLNINSTDFGVLPPHFNLQNAPIFSDDEWTVILPGYREYIPPNFRPVLPYLVASVLFHKNWLIEQLPALHPLFQSRLWRSENFHGLGERILTGKFFNPESNMKATGMPTHLVGVKNVESRLDSLEGKVNGNHDQSMETLERLPERLQRMIMDSFAIEGARPMNQRDIETLFNNFRDEVLQRIDSTTAAAGETPQFEGRQYRGETNIEGGWRVWSWGGRFHPVPENFSLPTNIGSKAIWDLFFDGSVYEGSLVCIKMLH